MMITTLFSSVGLGLLWVGGVVLLTRRWFSPSAVWIRCVWLSGLVTMLWIHCLNGPALWQWVSIFSTHLSIPTQIALGYMICQYARGRPPDLFQRLPYFSASIGVVGLLFYGLSLGLGSFDPYRLGFDPIYLPIVWGPFAVLVGAVQKESWGVYLLLLGTLGYIGHWLLSDNWWDYFVDPLLVLWVCCQSARSIWLTYKQGECHG